VEESSRKPPTIDSIWGDPAYSLCDRLPIAVLDPAVGVQGETSFTLRMHRVWSSPRPTTEACTSVVVDRLT